MGEPSLFANSAAAKLERLRAGLAPLSCRYDAVVANPPYMGSKNMNKWLNAWVKQHYADVKGDLFSCFMVRNSEMGNDHAQMGFMTPYVWMFISTYEKLRKFVIGKNTITSLIQLEYSGFAGATVPICTFTLQKGYVEGYKGSYIRLSDFVGADQQAPRALQALADPDCGWMFRRNGQLFKRLPGNPIAYWISSKVGDAYVDNKTFADVGHPKVGMQTSNNDRFLRLWWEVSVSERSDSIFPPIWVKYLKGGDYRKWYGNLDYLLHYNSDSSYILQQANAKVLDLEFLEKHKCTWTDLTSGEPSFRFAPKDTFYDISGHCFFPNQEGQMFLLGYANSSFVSYMKKVFNSSMHFQCGDLAKIVVPNCSKELYEKVGHISEVNVELSQEDWDLFETSQEFDRHPLA